MTDVLYGALSRLNRSRTQPGDVLRDYQTRPNPNLIFTGMWAGKIERGALTNDPARQLKHLGLVVDAASKTDPRLLSALHARRRAATENLVARSDKRVVRHLAITPMWRVVVGHGGENNYETGLTFSPVYGLPMWPGSALKGVTAAFAADTCDLDTKVRLFGSPRPDDRERDAQRGGVIVLDALPAVAPKLVVDVLTPHMVQYYRQVNGNEKITNPPAEYGNPIPVRFLAVADTTFHTSVLGKASDVTLFIELLTKALDDLGLGGKTAAGYGYCDVEQLP